MPDLPFKGEWMAMENFTDYNYSHYTEKIDKDSLLSHPKGIERIERLKKSFPELQNAGIASSKNNTFTNLQAIARKEDVANYHYLEKYGMSVYLTLYRLQKDPEDPYYKSWIGKNFKALYDAKKNYRLNRYIDRLVPNEQDESYQRFLNFLWNLNLSDMEAIANYYTEKGS